MAPMASTHDPDMAMNDSEKRALPEVLDMVAEYEKSPQHLDDAFQLARLQEQKSPRTRAATSPLERPGLHRKMSMELDNIGPPAFNTMATTASVSPSNRATNPQPEPRYMSPIAETHPKDAYARARPTPNPNNRWYETDLDWQATHAHLFFILKSIRNSVKRWDLELSPQNFRDFARKARSNWNKTTTNPELRRMCRGLHEMHEFLVCGPKLWTLSHALSMSAFEGMRDVVDSIIPHLQALISIEGCGWLDEQARTPLIGIDQRLFELLNERQAYKDMRFGKLPKEEQLPYKMGDMTMDEGYELAEWEG